MPRTYTLKSTKIFSKTMDDLVKNVAVANTSVIRLALVAGRQRGEKSSPELTGVLRSSWETQKDGVFNPTRAAVAQGAPKASGGVNIRRKVRAQIKRTMKKAINPMVEKAIKKTARKRRSRG